MQVRKPSFSGAYQKLFGVADGTSGDVDPLLAALEYVARAFGQPFSAAAVADRLPRGADGRTTLDLFPRAAAAVGLKARLIERRPSEVPGVLVPFIVVLENGDVGVVTEKMKRGRMRIAFPALGASAREIRAADLDRDAGGIVLLVAKDETRETTVEADTPTGRRRHWFWGEVAPLWPAWLQVALSALILNLLGLAFPLFVMNVYDRVIPNGAFPTLWVLASGIGLALVFEFLLRQLRAAALEDAGRRVGVKVSAQLFEQALAVAMRDRRSVTGSLASQIREFDTIREFFTSSSIIALTDLLFIGIFIAVLMAIVGPIAYVPMVVVPVVLALSLLLQFPLKKAVAQTQRHASGQHGLLVEALAGIETVKSVGGEATFQRRWEEAIAATARTNASVRFWSSFAVYLTAAAQQVVSIAIIVWGVFLITDGKITVGGLIAANLLAGRALAPLGSIAMTLARAQQSFAAMRSIGEIMALPPDRAPVLASGREIESGSIEFRGVTFGYPGAVIPALKDVSFTVKPGERIGVLGRVGSGKTTMGRLLAGLYPADSGIVMVDGAEVRQYDAANLRRAVAFVGQEAELFAGTLRDNIVIGHPQASESEIDLAVRTSGVQDFAGAHPLGLAMPLGEKGRGLSSGQRQAVALCRALLRRPKILFLDEPSSAMDTRTEAELIERLGAWADKDVTLLICTHRMSFLDLVDRVMVFNAGVLVADGPKADVIRRLSVPAEARRGGTP